MGLGLAALFDHPLSAACPPGTASKDDAVAAADDEALQLRSRHLSVRLGDADTQPTLPGKHLPDLLQSLLAKWTSFGWFSDSKTSNACQILFTSLKAFFLSSLMEISGKGEPE